VRESEGDCVHSSEVECEHALVLDALGHLTCDDALCETLGNGRLSDSRLSNQTRIAPASAEAAASSDP